MKEFKISGFGDGVSVKEADLEEGSLGCFDERTGDPRGDTKLKL